MTREPRSDSTSTTARRSSGTSTCPGSGRDSATATESTGPTTAGGAALQPRQASDRPVREGDRRRRRLARRQHAALRAGRRRGRGPADRQHRRRRRDPQERRHRSALRLGWRSAARAKLERRTVIYETHVKGSHDAPPRRARGAERHLRRDSAPSPIIDHLRGLGITAVELLPVHHIADESFLVDRGLSNYWGYSSIGYFAPHSAYSSAGSARRAGPRVQADGQVAARRRHRGDPGRRLQPHRRGQPPRTDAVVQGRRQRRLLPAQPGEPRATTWTSPGPATP